jgi:hypothetical protein
LDLESRALDGLGFGLLGPRSNISLLFVRGTCRVLLVSFCFRLEGKKNWTSSGFRQDKYPRARLKASSFSLDFVLGKVDHWTRNFINDVIEKLFQRLFQRPRFFPFDPLNFERPRE